MNLIEIQSKFQKIVIANDPLHREEHILYLDDAWQYGSAFEYRYHESIATMPACACDDLQRVLIGGGGDGLAAREILKFPEVEIDLVEIDEEVIKLFSEERMLLNQNCKSLISSRCRTYAQDAVGFAKRSTERYDFIILDFPSPSGGNQKKNYLNLFDPEITNVFIDRLHPDGILVSQTSIPAEYMAKYARNVLDKGFYLWSYDSYYNKQGSHDTFMVACRNRLTQRRPIPKGCRYATNRHLQLAFSEVTEINYDELEYFELYEHVESVEYEIA